MSVRTVVVSQLASGRLTLDAAESHHLLHVIRLPRGGAVRVTDGAGNHALATLDNVEAGLATLAVGPMAAEPASPACVVLLGAPKPALLEEAISLGTEAGATAFWIVCAARSLAVAPRLDRLERVLDAALKQSRRADRPLLRVFPTLLAALAADPPGARFLAAPAGAPPREAWLDAGDATPLTLAIGPEGGWSPEELDALIAADFVAVSFGAAVLRTPTAVAIGIGALNASR